MARTYYDIIEPPPPPASIESWAKGIEIYIEIDWKAAQKNRNPAASFAWNAHDQDLQDVVGEFNSFLSNTPGYQSLDWLLVKAILFVETNARSEYWQTALMQSANPGDLGYGALMGGPSKLDLIVPPMLRGNLAAPNLNAADNITAGVAYLLLRAAEFGYKIVIIDQSVKSVTVQKGDSVDGIARKVHSTEDIIKALNPFVNLTFLKPGMVLKYQAADKQLTITGWQSITPDSIASTYNANGRGVYALELTYAYDLIKRNKFLQ